MTLSIEQIHTEHNDYLFTSDRGKTDIIAVHKWLSEVSYWKKNIPFDVMKNAVQNSFCINVLKENEQVGFCRLITDYTTFAYLADVYILEEHRGQGLSKKMMDVMMELSWVKEIQRIMLATVDAHKLYEQYGFTPLRFTERFMEINRPELYNDPDNPFL